MSLPPVVSDPVWCGQRTYKALHDWDPENWECGSCDYGLPMNCTCPEQVCRFCGGRKP